MDCIRPEQLIYSLWDQVMRQGRDALVPGLWDRPDIAMHFQVRIEVDNHGYEKDGHTFHTEWVRSYHRIIHVLVTARHRCYVASTQGVFHLEEVLPDAWVNTSNHDSCWHTDGLQLFHKSMMEAWEHCWSHVPNKHRVSPNAMHKFCQFGAGFASQHVLSFAKIEREPIDDSKYAYFDRLKSVKPIKFGLTIKE